MLRASFIYLSHAHWARTLVTRTPLAWRAASRFVSGETIEQAIGVVQRVNSKGLIATLDFLGESVSTEAEARQAAEAYVQALDHLAAAKARANVSLKLTQFGLDISTDLCEANVRRVLEKARATGSFVRVDMEGTPHTDRTLALVHTLRRDFDNIGTVLQAYLYRTEADQRALIEAGIPVRLCKGAYNEPADKAFPRKADTDTNYIKLMQQLMSAAVNAPPALDGRRPPLAALATHDERIITEARRYAEEQRIPRDRFEFQMLYGVRRELQEELTRQGYAMRVYVPYGRSWYPYFMRRLAERPANVWFILSNYFRR